MNGVKAPLADDAVEAAKDGAKPAGQASPAMSKGSLCASTGTVPDHGASRAVPLLGPQSSGVASGARGPSRKSTASSPNGSCGLPGKLAVSCPLPLSGRTEPLSRIETPRPSTVTNSRYMSPASGCPT